MFMHAPMGGGAGKGGREGAGVERTHRSSLIGREGGMYRGKSILDARMRHLCSKSLVAFC